MQVPRQNSTSNNSSSFGSMYTMAGVAAISVVAWFVYQGYLETRVNTPLHEEKAVVTSLQAKSDRYWGSYRPGVYFGLKTRDSESLLAGLMWFLPTLAAHGQLNIRYSYIYWGFNFIIKLVNLVRHLCEQGDNLERYGWLEHDGRNFGVQEIMDKFIKLNTSFVTKPGGEHGGDWTAKIRVEPIVSLYYLSSTSSRLLISFYYILDERIKGRTSDSDVLSDIRRQRKGTITTNPCNRQYGYHNDGNKSVNQVLGVICCSRT